MQIEPFRIVLLAALLLGGWPQAMRRAGAQSADVPNVVVTFDVSASLRPLPGSSRKPGRVTRAAHETARDIVSTLVTKGWGENEKSPPGTTAPQVTPLIRKPVCGPETSTLFYSFGSSVRELDGSRAVIGNISQAYINALYPAEFEDQTTQLDVIAEKVCRLCEGPAQKGGELVWIKVSDNTIEYEANSKAGRTEAEKAAIERLQQLKGSYTFRPIFTAYVEGGGRTEKGDASAIVVEVLLMRPWSTESDPTFSLLLKRLDELGREIQEGRGDAAVLQANLDEIRRLLAGKMEKDPAVREKVEERQRGIDRLKASAATPTPSPTASETPVVTPRPTPQPPPPPPPPPDPVSVGPILGGLAGIAALIGLVLLFLRSAGPVEVEFYELDGNIERKSGSYSMAASGDTDREVYCGQVEGQQVFDVGAPDWHVRRTRLGFRLCSTDSSLKTRVGPGTPFTVTNTGGDEVTLRIGPASAEVRDEPPAAAESEERDPYQDSWNNENDGGARPRHEEQEEN